jgi:hypothetical protein
VSTNAPLAVKLPPKVHAQLQEVRDIVALLNLDPEALSRSRRDPESQLIIAKHKLVRGQLVIWYTLIDEFLANRMCRYFFGTNRSFPQLWRTTKFRVFNHFIVETLTLLEKLRLARKIAPIPKAICQDIERLNALRNGMAHAFFPENLRTLKPLWRGKDVFSLEGLRTLKEDMDHVIGYFARREPWPK